MPDTAPQTSPFQQQPDTSQYSSPIGSNFRPIHMVRDMLVYPVNESDITTLERDITHAKKFESISSACVSAAVAIVISYVFADKQTAVGQLLLFVIAPICLYGAYFYHGLAEEARKAYDSTWVRIKSESRPVVIDPTKKQ